MDEKDISLITEQLRNIILNKPLPPAKEPVSPDCQEVENAILYLSECLTQLNSFLDSLCRGTLDVTPPDRHNFLAGNLKELHSVLKHLTWQAMQVASGDYSQRIQFLGEFSEAFNEMVRQLEEREVNLKEKRRILDQTTQLLMSIISAHKDWILVVDADSKNVIYNNESCERNFLNITTQSVRDPANQPLFEKIQKYDCGDVSSSFEFYSTLNFRFYLVECSPMEWSGIKSFVYFISDITEQKQSHSVLSTLAYKDELTGVYNRRYCLEQLEELHLAGADFTMALIDLDGLKYVNDTFGHLSGDEYICTVTRIVKNNIRSADILCRIGGDEFILIFKACSEKAAQDKLGALYREIKSVEREYPMCISYGITFVEGNSSISVEDLLKLTDSKMYAFKKEHKRQSE